MENQGEMSHSQRWSSLEIVKGKFGPEDTVNDIAEIKFERPIPIRVSCFIELACINILSHLINK